MTIAASLKLKRFQGLLLNTLLDIRTRLFQKIYSLAGVNFLIILFQIFYLLLRIKYVNNFVPFWYTALWGDAQLAQKNYLFFIPVISFLITLTGLFFIIPLKRYYVRYGLGIVSFFTVLSNILLTFSLIRIIFIASTPFPPLIEPLYLELIVPGIVAFLSMYYLLPFFISYAEENDLMTNPNIHHHPGMLLVNAAARGGGVVYSALFLFLAIFFIGFPKNLIPFYVSLTMLAVLAFVDDYQNTHPESKWRFMESPMLRLLSLFLIVSIVATFSIKIFSVTSPLGGIFTFNSYFISLFFTVVWIVWVMNVLSWSNGIDGQYGGIIGIASILIIFLALRFEKLEPIHETVALLGAVSAGLSFGMTKFTWHPSKIMWGFGAVCAGLVLSVLSILINSKILTSILIVLIPFLDASVIFVRRILQGKSPLKGDRGHLHHLLLDRGWSIRKIAVFYWLTTALFGFLGLVTADKFTIQVGFILVGLVAFGLIILNIKFTKKI